MSTFTDQFQTQRAKHFDPVRDRLGLADERYAEAATSGCAIVSAASGPVRVYFSSDRMLWSFSIGFADEASSFCDVEEVAGLIARSRLFSDGNLRLSLEEQASFICNHWRELRSMFSPERESETRAWRAARAAAYTKRFSGGA